MSCASWSTRSSPVRDGLPTSTKKFETSLVGITFDLAEDSMAIRILKRDVVGRIQTRGFASMHELPFDSDPECRELITVRPFSFR